jgi:Flp pilus assembly protein TadG
MRIGERRRAGAIVNWRVAVRRGATTVEMAIVAPLFFLFVFGLVEFGRVQMVKNMMHAACRSAARLGAMEGVKTADVRNRVLQMMGSSMDTSKLNVLVKNASVYDAGGATPQTVADVNNLPNIEVDSALTRQLFVVRATVSYNDIAIVPLPMPSGAHIVGQAFMRHE